MPSGKIRFYNEDKGFGFIQGDDGQEVFLHASVLPADAEVQPGMRVEYGVAEGKRGPQALSVRLLEKPRAARRERKSPDEMAVIVEDLVKLLDSIGGDLRHGRYPSAAAGRKVAAVLRKVADDLDA